MEKPILELSAIFASSIENLTVASALTKTACALVTGRKLSDEFSYDAELAVSELVTNAIKHAGRPEDEIKISLRVYTDRLKFSVSDKSMDFDIADARMPDLEVAQIGGYGLYIVRTVTDRLYQEKADGLNTIVFEMNFR